MVLNLAAERDWETRVPDLVRARAEGWAIEPVRTWEELVGFARRFSEVRYAERASRKARKGR